MGEVEICVIIILWKYQKVDHANTMHWITRSENENANF